MTTFDAHKNFAWSLITGAPSPALSGTALEVVQGDGVKFPTPPFNVTVGPTGALPATGNTEVLRVTAIVGDTLTVTRAQEGSAARAILPGDQIAAGITAKTATDIEAGIAAAQAASDPVGSASTAQAAAIAASEQGLTRTSVKTSAYTAAPGDSIPVDVSTANVTVTLPTAPANKSRVGVKVVTVNATPGTFSLTIAAGGSDVFNKTGGSTTLVLTAQFQGVTLKYDAATSVWTVQSTDTPLGNGLGAAKLGTDGTVGGPSGSSLTSSVVLGTQIADLTVGSVPAIHPSTFRDSYNLDILYGTGANARIVKATTLGRVSLRITNPLVDPISVGTSALNTVTGPSSFVTVAPGQEFLTDSPLPYWAYAPTTGGHTAGDDAGFIFVTEEQSA